jgi:EmrB/QacA subfamily drug resistance transporter
VCDFSANGATRKSPRSHSRNALDPFEWQSRAIVTDETSNSEAAENAPVTATSHSHLQSTSATLKLGTVLALVSMVQFVLQLDASIVNLALPTIQRGLNFAPVNLQWIVTGYALTFGSLLLFGGRLGDLMGHRRLMIIGLALFGLMSLSAGLAQTSAMIIISRFAQGASAALVAPQAFATVTDLYAEGPARSRALGILQGMTAAGGSAGIVLGGILTQYIGWRAIFLVNPPIVFVIVVLMMRFLPRVESRHHARLDAAGAVLATTSIASLIYGLSQGQQRGFTSSVSIIALAAAVVLGVTFIIVERRIIAPMVPFQFLADRVRKSVLCAMVLMGAVVAAYVYFVSLYLQRVLHFSAALTGVAMLPSAATMMITSILVTRRLLARYGVKYVLLFGFLSTGLGQLWLFRVTAESTYPISVLVGLLLAAFGMGLVYPAVAVAITSQVKTSELGLVGGLFITSQQIGAATGLAALATIAAARTSAAHGSLVSGYELSFLVGGCLATGALAIVFFGLRTRIHRPAIMVEGLREDS